MTVPQASTQPRESVNRRHWGFSLLSTGEARTTVARDSPRSTKVRPVFVAILKSASSSCGSLQTVVMLSIEITLGGFFAPESGESLSLWYSSPDSLSWKNLWFHGLYPSTGQPREFWCRGISCQSQRSAGELRTRHHRGAVPFITTVRTLRTLLRAGAWTAGRRAALRPVF